MNSFIKSLMDEKGLKQKDLAEILGITPAAVSQWNEDGTNISVDYLYFLSKLFHVTVDELIDGKRAIESFEEKWSKEYHIDKDVALEAMRGHDKEALLQCIETATKANDRFFKLYEKKIAGRISGSELKEWAYIRRFYRVNILMSSVHRSSMCGHIDDIDEFALKILTDEYGTINKKAILWEIKNMYKIEDFGIDESILSDYDKDIFIKNDADYEDVYYDADIFYAWYNILTPLEKDNIINDVFAKKGDRGFTFLKDRLIDDGLKKKKDGRAVFLYEMIKRGGNVLYSSNDLRLGNYDYKDLEGLDGVRPVSELDRAYAATCEIHDKYSPATYEQYQSLINFPRMRQIEMEAKYKEKTPIKYWEYIKNDEVLI